MKNVVFVKSATEKKDYPTSRNPEIALLGRSNSGKSSLLNALAKRKIAFVSQQPGKTLTLNFFDVDDQFWFVDVPGYGYAKRPKDLRESWGAMIEGYLRHRKNLVGAILIMDCRREWSEDEEQLRQWLVNGGRKLIVVVNKIDKLNQKELSDVKRKFPILPETMVFYTSVLKGTHIDELREFVLQEWIDIENSANSGHNGVP